LRVADQQLSKNFALSELVQSQTALRGAIDNSPDATVLAHLTDLCVNLLQPLRDALGPMRVSSGYRSPALNAAILGSSKTSAHMEGSAADLNPLSVSIKEAVEWLIASSLQFDQVIFEGMWLHAGWRKAGTAPRRQVLMMFGGKYSNYDPKDPRVG
jgi:hypothetical protein